MPDLSDPLDVMQSRAQEVRYKAKRLRNDAALLLARAEELEALSDALEKDASDVQKWMPKPNEK